ncbi:hypothetical protein SAMN05720606_107108 [Paenibacillus polysaccharolyticus]|uniref:Uncharacterized protein n=2 Tax=Paenibacillus TaxID=44249 RepID=A0A1G5HNC0_9BACL|nr:MULTISPECIES: hypothetical protein [Paenibacillus]MBY0206325.1 hypothetical protein [Paenibacillus cucumis (ex Kampfer et al. 2016)]MCM3134629.1 hypothetical protein [Paenibacillus polysaccharolyticus]MDP9701217.1 hypothetical protein [Paenibacillus intestini]SCY65276.1 hypothetical protein SAMN05720606_107108 [Paenibacillus polysaccharolyticus]
MLKKKSRLKSKRALLARGARLRKIRKLRALKSKRVVHKRTGKGRSAWLKKKKRTVQRHRNKKLVRPVAPVTPTDPNPDSAYSQGYNEAYNEGFNAGFAKGFEDGHQLAYKAQ